MEVCLVLFINKESRLINELNYLIYVIDKQL
jgi:hypothetical protein